MNSALLGLAAALSWGFHDFAARFPSRAVGPIPTVFAVTLSGLIVLSAWLPASALAAKLDQNCVISILNRTIQVDARGGWAMPNVPSLPQNTAARSSPCGRRGPAASPSRASVPS